MSVSLEPGEDGGRKSVDLHLNLVPFIDMMSCLVAFLLITAVWSNVTQLHVSPRPDGVSAAAGEPELGLAILIARDAHFVGRSDGTILRIPLVDGARDWTAVAGSLPELATLRGVDIAAEDGVDYQTIVATMDLTVARGYDEVALVAPSALARRFMR